jgi:16S rRNA processing protein RimM
MARPRRTPVALPRGSDQPPSRSLPGAPAPKAVLVKPAPRFGVPSRYTPEKLVLIGQLCKPHGVKGEIRCHPITDYPERFENTVKVQLFEKTGSPARELEISAARWQSGKVLLQFVGVDTVDKALEIRGYYVAVGEDELVPLEPGEFYHFELEGLDAYDENDVKMGVLTEVLSTPAHEIYVIQGPEGEILVPAVPAYILRVDTAARLIQLKRPCE